jgi:hypothetical protein
MAAPAPLRNPRRMLHFQSLDDAVRDAEILLSTGYEQRGAWTLGQVCDHLAHWLRYPVEGYPRVPMAIRMVLGVLRHTVGQRQLRRLLEAGTMPAGRPTLPESVPPPNGDDAAAVARFREAVRHFQAHSGPFHDSPIFGPLDRDTATRLQLIHCVHHLSFLVPKDH